jgi:hypothetical protein
MRNIFSLRKTILFSCLTVFHSLNGLSQEPSSIYGKLIDSRNQPLSYASAGLFKMPDSLLAGGTLSDEQGTFSFNHIPAGSYTVVAAAVGYKTASKHIVVVQNQSSDAGLIMLGDTAILIRETVITAERVKARAEDGKTTYTVTKKMLDASSSGSDVLKQVPGVSIDLMQNISIEGSPDILILVDGKERDKDFIGHLNPKNIEKIEVINRPSSGYDASISGVLNIILKKESEAGLSGQVHAEIPTSSQVYIFPSASLNYEFKNLNLYASYAGQQIYLDQDDATTREIFSAEGNDNMSTHQYVRQKDWSHRINYGADYDITPRDRFSFYSFYNCFSRELDGHTTSTGTGNINYNWTATREDSDRNEAGYYSFYFRHNFPGEGKYWSVEAGDYRMKSHSSTLYSSPEAEQLNKVEPTFGDITLKSDFAGTLAKNLGVNLGFKMKWQDMQDKTSGDFHYTDRIFGLYGSMLYVMKKFETTAGIRAENAMTEMEDNFSTSSIDLFPQASLKYSINERRNIRISYKRSINRPNVYQLNPYVSVDGPFAMTTGNPYLEPAFIREINLDYNHQYKSDFLQAGLFYMEVVDAISNLTQVNDTGYFETQVNNLGTIRKYGTNFSGTFKAGPVTINPYINFYVNSSEPNKMTREHGFDNSVKLGIESGLSTVVSFHHEINATFNFQYTSPFCYIAESRFADPLYMFSLEKSFRKQFKASIVYAFPMTREFSYQVREVTHPDFRVRNEGNIQASHPFIWLTFSWQFAKGTSRQQANQLNEDVDTLPKKGF